MPYLHRFKRIPRNLDRRVKFTEADKATVRKLYDTGRYSQRTIARATKISRRMVSFILFPEKEIRCKQQHKERRKDGRYYHQDTWAETIKEHRHYKESIKLVLVDRPK